MLRCPITTSALLCLVAILALVNRTNGACSQFGHSCFGAHGKRSGLPPPPPPPPHLPGYSARDLLERFTSAANNNNNAVDDNNNADEDYIPSLSAGDQIFDDFNPHGVSGGGLSGSASDDFAGIGEAGEIGNPVGMADIGRHRTSQTANILDRLMMLTSYSQRNFRRNSDTVQGNKLHGFGQLLASLSRTNPGGGFNTGIPQSQGRVNSSPLQDDFAGKPSKTAPRSPAAPEEYHPLVGSQLEPRLGDGFGSSSEGNGDLRKWLGRLQRQLLQHQPQQEQQQQQLLDLASARTQQQQQQHQNQKEQQDKEEGTVGGAAPATTNTRDY